MKKGKKLVCGFLAVAILTGIGFNSYSSLSIKGVNANQRPTKEIVQDVKIYTDEYVPLLDTNGNEIAKYYGTVNGGYAIIENNDDVIEFDDDTPIDNVKDNKEMYYFGPTQIFEKKYDTLVSVHDSTYEVAFNDVSETYFNFIAEAKKIEDEVITASVEESEYEETCNPQKTIEPGVWVNLKGGHGNTLYKNTDCLDTNRKDNCGSTAAAIMLLYYDRYVSTKYVNNKYRKVENWQEFTDKLIGYIEPNGGGSSTSDVKNGINKYLKTRKIRPVCTSVDKNGIFKDAKEVLVDKIDADRPIMLLFNDHPYFGNHWVVAEGYFIQDSGKKYTYACINNGWGDNRSNEGKRMYVNMGYAVSAAYLN